MAIRIDVRDILEVFLIANIGPITQNSLNINFPPELQTFVDTQVINNIGSPSYDASFSSDLRDVLSTFILDNLNTLETVNSVNNTMTVNNTTTVNTPETPT